MNTNSLLLYFFHHYLEEHQLKPAQVIHNPQQVSQMMTKLNHYAMLEAAMLKIAYQPNSPETVKEHLIAMLETNR